MASCEGNLNFPSPGQETGDVSQQRVQCEMCKQAGVGSPTSCSELHINLVKSRQIPSLGTRWINGISMSIYLFIVDNMEWYSDYKPPKNIEHTHTQCCSFKGFVGYLEPFLGPLVQNLLYRWKYLVWGSKNYAMTLWANYFIFWTFTFWLTNQSK